MEVGEATAAAFYFDLASPFAYLAAERVLHDLPVAAEWRPVLARELCNPDETKLACRQANNSRTREHQTHSEQQQHQQQHARTHGEPHAQTHIDERARMRIEERAQELGLQRLRWPQPFPFDSGLAMRVATYAKQIGRTVPFAQAAFRQAYAGGRSLQDSDSVLIAAAACEMHPAAVLRAAQLRSVAEQLESTTAQAAREGVREVPAIVLLRARGTGSEARAALVFEGERALDDAAAQLVRSDANAGAA